MKGRGADHNPPNRYLATQLDLEEPVESPHTQFLFDDAKSIISRNDSPDIPFEFSVNAYRGCEHGCVYCYARPTHEQLGFGAGLDFETKIMVKRAAPALLDAALAKKSWKGEPITMSGVTDCYQPAERRFKLTRACLEVLKAHKNPVNIITKNVLVLRDLDLLAAMAQENLVHVFLSVTSLDGALQRSMEPRTAPPELRLEAIRRLAAAGVPVGALIAPIIPGLNDGEIPRLLAAVKDAGAHSARYQIVRLPLTVEPVFLSWLDREWPLKAKRVRSRIKDVRDGAMSDAQFGRRMRGTGVYAEQIAATFTIFARRLGLERSLPPLDSSRYLREVPRPGLGVQGELQFPD